MMLKKGATLFLVLLAVSLIAYGLFQLSFDELLRALAVSLALTILYVVFFPKLRGVRRGDAVLVVGNTPLYHFLGKRGVALESARINDQLRVMLAGGSEVIGVLEAYEELLSPPRVRVIYEERIVK